MVNMLICRPVVCSSKRRVGGQLGVTTNESTGASDHSTNGNVHGQVLRFMLLELEQTLSTIGRKAAIVAVFAKT